MKQPKKYKKTPDIKETLNADGRDAYLKYSQALIYRDSLTPVESTRVHHASFIEQQLRSIEKQMAQCHNADKLDLYIDLSRELREIRNELFDNN